MLHIKIESDMDEDRDSFEVTHFWFITGEKSQLSGLLENSGTVSDGGRMDDLDVEIGEALVVLAACSEIDQRNLKYERIVQFTIAK